MQRSVSNNRLKAKEQETNRLTTISEIEKSNSKPSPLKSRHKQNKSVFVFQRNLKTPSKTPEVYG